MEDNFKAYLDFFIYIQPAISIGVRAYTYMYNHPGMTKILCRMLPIDRDVQLKLSEQFLSNAWNALYQMPDINIISAGMHACIAATYAMTLRVCMYIRARCSMCHELLCQVCSATHYTYT